jgi:TatD DNase family protein
MDPAFDADRPQVFDRAHAAGVIACLQVGYDLTTSRAAIDLARTTPNTWAAVGIHPNSAAEASDADFEAVAELARAPEVVAIGETGLDTYRRFTPIECQQEAFAWHLQLAELLDLPDIIHNRNADADVAAAVAGRTVRGILHCFSSTDHAYLVRMLDAGFWVSFAGTLTFKNAQPLREVATDVPAERLLVETDSPYLAPEPHRGRRNEPAYVRDTAQCLAEVLDTPFARLSEALWANTLSVFPALSRIAA